LMSRLSWVYHGRDAERCYYEASCCVCITRTLLQIIRWRLEHKDLRKLRKTLKEVLKVE